MQNREKALNAAKTEGDRLGFPLVERPVFDNLNQYIRNNPNLAVMRLGEARVNESQALMNPAAGIIADNIASSTGSVSALGHELGHYKDTGRHPFPKTVGDAKANSANAIAIRKQKFKGEPNMRVGRFLKNLNADPYEMKLINSAITPSILIDPIDEQAQARIKSELSASRNGKELLMSLGQSERQARTTYSGVPTYLATLHPSVLSNRELTAREDPRAAIQKGTRDLFNKARKSYSKFTEADNEYGKYMRTVLPTHAGRGQFNWAHFKQDPSKGTTYKNFENTPIHINPSDEDSSPYPTPTKGNLLEPAHIRHYNQNQMQRVNRYMSTSNNTGNAIERPGYES